MYPLILQPIIQCKTQSHFDYKTSDLSLQIQKKKKTSQYLNANLDMESLKMRISVTHMAM